MAGEFLALKWRLHVLRGIQWLQVGVTHPYVSCSAVGLLQPRRDGCRPSDSWPGSYVCSIILLLKPAARHLTEANQLKQLIGSNPHKVPHWIQSKARGA